MMFFFPYHDYLSQKSQVDVGRPIVMYYDDDVSRRCLAVHR